MSDEKSAEKSAENTPASSVPAALADLTVAELRSLAADEGVAIPPKARKGELIALLESHFRAMTPRHGQEICKKCGAPLRVRSTRAPARTPAGTIYQTRYVQCKGPLCHRYKIVALIDN